MEKLTIPTANITERLSALGKIGNLGLAIGDGFLRASWSQEETAAMDYFKQLAEDKGFSSRNDAVGNLFLRFPADWDGEVVQVGSHLDTVPKGGLYDGGAGIVAGIEALLSLRNAFGDKLKRGLELVIWRGEESGTYGDVYKGSKAAFGELPVAALATVYDGQTLEAAIRSEGFDPKYIEQGKAAISQGEIDKIAAHIELHIEQATKLEIDGDDIGIVTSIRGPKRYRVIVRGEAAHSGATPMGTGYRQDANLAIAYMHVRLNEALLKKASTGSDLVQTIGVLNSDRDFNEKNTILYENGITKVSNFGYFALDVRSNYNKTLDEHGADCLQIIKDTANEFKVDVEIIPLGSSKALENLDPKLQQLFANKAELLKLRYQMMPSGAGHDVTVVARQKKSDGSTIPSLLIFIPCRDGISHNPKEFATDDAIQKGAELIANALSELVS